jgi:hypothetical protein
MKARFSATVILAVLLGVLPAAATTIAYNDLGSWSAATTGGITQLTIPDTLLLLGQGNASLVTAGATFSASSSLGDGYLFQLDSSYAGVPMVSDQQLENGVENILVSLPESVTAVSFNFDTFNGSDVSYLLSNGDSGTVGSTASNYSIVDFLGLTSDTAFNSILLTSPDYVFNAGNFEIAGEQESSSVPEPATLLLVASGLFAGVKRLRKNVNK